MPYDQTQQIAPALNPGDKIGYFDVGNPLAAGGMSLVWKGYDKLLNRHVAIKQIAAGSAADESMRERFRREADIQKRVSASHKNLVQVIDFIDEPRGLFIVMEYVDGSSLDTVLAKLEGPMDPKQALGIVHQIAVALVSVHGAGILHRDLKPSNILLPREGGVKLCDFGLAAVADDQDVLTLGTARYMAPELFTGQPADARCDLYSLGMIAYEMLAGRPAFEETFKTVLRDQRSQALRWMKWHTNLRLAAPPLISLNPKIPAELSELIARLMAKDASQRVPSAAALIEVMKRLFTGRPAQTPAPVQQAPSAQAMQAASDPTAPLPKKSKLPLILGVVLGVQVLAIAGWLGISSYRQSSSLTNARQQITADLKHAFALYDEGDYAQALESFQPIVEKWGKDEKLGAPCQSGLMLTQGRLLIAEGNEFNKAMEFAKASDAFDKARDLADQAEDIGGSNLDRMKDLRSEAQNNASFSRSAQTIMELTRADKFTDARQRIRQLGETQTNRFSPEGKLLGELANYVEDQAARSQIDMVLTQARQLVADGRPDQALNVLNDALANNNSPELRDLARQITASINYDKTLASARAAEDAGDLAKARTLYRQAAAMRPSKELTDKDKQLSSRQHMLAGRKFERDGRYEEASIEYDLSNKDWPNDAAVQAKENLKGTVSKQAYIQTGDAAMAAGDYATAISVYKKAMELGADPAIQTKINQATIRMKTIDAQNAMARDDLNGAGDLLAEALQLDPTDAIANRTKAELNVRIKYKDSLTKGDDARKRSQFGEATKHYIDARSLLKGTSIPTDEITQRISDTEFDSWIAKAKAAIEAKQWVQARAALTAAEHMHDNEIVRKLKAEVDRNDPNNK